MMTEFYRNLLERKLESLRQAQLALFHRFEPKSGTLRGFQVNRTVLPTDQALSPFYWVAFSHNGDWR